VTAGPTERGFLTFEGRKGRETIQRKKERRSCFTVSVFFVERISYSLRQLRRTFLEARTRGRNLHDDGNRFSKFFGVVNQSRLMPLFGTSALHWTHFLCKALNKSFLRLGLWLGSR
jgi:hypothetical protein